MYRKTARYLNSKLKRGDKPVNNVAVWRFLKCQNLKPLHRSNAPAITLTNQEHRVDLHDYLSNLTYQQWLNFYFIDEFFIWAQRKINTKNDIIWSDNKDEILELLHSRKYANPECVGVCVIMSAKTIRWVIKKDGQSWNGEYFRGTIIPVIQDFVEDEDNFYDNSLACGQHDCAPGWAANATQDDLKDADLDFIWARGYGRWPGNSPDLNPIENLGSCLMNEVENELNEYDWGDRNNRDLIIQILRKVLRRYKRQEADLFKRLVLSFPTRLKEVKANGGKPLKY